jgi:hypothetical protein
MRWQNVELERSMWSMLALEAGMLEWLCVPTLTKTGASVSVRRRVQALVRAFGATKRPLLMTNSAPLSL